MQDYLAWKGIDGDHEVVWFYGITLKKDIGSLKEGAEFGSASLDIRRGTLEFYNGENDVVAKFAASVIIGEQQT